MNEITEAIKRLQGRYMNHAMAGSTDEVNAENKAIDLAIEALREYAERHEPKPLTVEELKSLNGKEPIWDDCLCSWCAVRGGMVSYIGGGSRPLKSDRFYRHKPRKDE